MFFDLVKSTNDILSFIIEIIESDDLPPTVPTSSTGPYGLQWSYQQRK